jgi:hypothetical protein
MRGRAGESVVLLARVRAGEAAAARAAIAEHWPARQSPFALVPGTHLARVQVLRPPGRRFRRAPGEHLLLAADFDGALAPWLLALRAAAAGPLDAVLSHCAFYPGTAEPAAFVRWVLANRTPVGFSVIGSPGATVAEVSEALALRDRLAAFAQSTQRLGPSELRAAWGEWRNG